VLKDVECVKKNRERMRRVGESPVNKCVRRKQVAIFIMYPRLGNGEPRKKRDPDKNRGGSDRI